MFRTNLYIGLILLAGSCWQPRFIPAQVSLNLLEKRNEKTVPEFLFQAKSKDGFLPHVDDFRLERIEPTYRWIPILFGNEDMQRQLLDDESIHSIDLTLKAVVLNQQVKMLKKLPMEEQEHYRMTGEAVLESGATYKLSLSLKTGDAKESYDSSITFETKENSMLSKVDENEPMSSPCYLGEVLFLDDQGNLFLGQKPMWDHRPTPAVSFRNGRYIEPPDPQHEKMMEIIDVSLGHWKPPLAKVTHYWQMNRDTQMNRLLQIAVSDLATNVDLPKSGPTLKCFNEALFRVSEIEGNIENLRQDEEYWKARCLLIFGEAAKHSSEDVREWARKNRGKVSSTNK